MDIRSYRDDIESAPFHIAYIFDDPDDNLWAWQYVLNNLCDKHAQWKNVKVRSISTPWMTNDIRLKMNRRYKLFKEACAVSTKCPRKWSAYKMARNNVTSEVGKAKTTYFSIMFDEVQSTTAYWNLMKRATDHKVPKTIGPVKIDHGTVAFADQEKACIMNYYFTIAVLNLASNLPPITGKRQGANTSPKDNRTVPLLKEVYVSGLAIQNKLEAQNANKSVGPDNIQPKLLKLARGAIIPSLESLHQYSIQTKTVFTSWKPAKITPVFQNDEEQIGATIDESPC